MDKDTLRDRLEMLAAGIANLEDACFDLMTDAIGPGIRNRLRPAYSALADASNAVRLILKEETDG